MSASLQLENGLWRFALGFYARPGVAPACLALQNRLSLDVNILLLAVFAAAERGIELDAEDIAEADAGVARWRGSVVQALRRIRTELKTGSAPAPSPATDRLREGMKALELQAEQIELAVLQDWLDRRERAGRPGCATAEAPIMSVARYFGGGEVPVSDPEIAGAIRTISEEARACRAAKTNT